VDYELPNKSSATPSHKYGIGVDAGADDVGAVLVLVLALHIGKP
jgi:hypothetical protein